MIRTRWIGIAAVIVVLVTVCASAGSCTHINWAPSIVNNTGAGTDGSDAFTDVEEDGPTYRLGIGFSSPGSNEMFEAWKKAVENETGGDLVIELFGENTLGTGSEMLKAVQKGTLSIVFTSTSVCTQIVPETAVLDIPLCFPEYSRPYFSFKGEFFERMNLCFNKRGLELMDLRTGDGWTISSAEKIGSLADLDGKRIRTSGNAVLHNKLYNELGISCVDGINLGGIGYVIDEGEIDGIEATYPMLDERNLFEKQPYIYEINLFTMCSAVVINRDVFMGLPEKYREIMKRTLAEVRDAEDAQKPGAKEAMEAGVTITRVSDGDAERLREAAAPMKDAILERVDESLAEALKKELLLNRP